MPTSLCPLHRLDVSPGQCDGMGRADAEFASLVVLDTGLLVWTRGFLSGCMSLCPMRMSGNQVSFNWDLSCMGCSSFPPHHSH